MIRRSYLGPNGAKNNRLVRMSLGGVIKVGFCRRKASHAFCNCFDKKAKEHFDPIGKLRHEMH